MDLPLIHFVENIMFRDNVSCKADLFGYSILTSNSSKRQNKLKPYLLTAFNKL